MGTEERRQHCNGLLLSPASRAWPGPKRVQRDKQGPATKGRAVHVGRGAQSNTALQPKPPNQALCDGGKEKGRAGPTAPGCRVAMRQVSSAPQHPLPPKVFSTLPPPLKPCKSTGDFSAHLTHGRNKAGSSPWPITYRGFSHHCLAVVDPHYPFAPIPLQQDTHPSVEGNGLFAPGGEEGRRRHMGVKLP